MKGKNYLWAIVGLLILAALIYIVVKLTLDSSAEGSDDDTLVEVDCGNGKKSSRYKHPSKMFPIIIRDYSTNVKVTTDILNKIIGDSTGNSSIGVDATNKAQRLRAELDQDNAFYENQLKAIFFEVNRKPCDDSLSNLYTSYVREMSFKVIQMKQFVSNVSKPATEVKNNSSGAKKPIAVIDPSKAQVKKLTDTIKPNELVVIKEENKINQAIKTLDEKIANTPPQEEYRVLVVDDRYTGKNYFSEIRNDNGETIVTVHVTDVNESLTEAIMYLSKAEEKTLPFSVKAQEPTIKLLDNKTYRVTINVKYFGKRGRTRVAYYTVSVEKRV